MTAAQSFTAGWPGLVCIVAIPLSVWLGGNLADRRDRKAVKR